MDKWTGGAQVQRRASHPPPWPSAFFEAMAICMCIVVKQASTTWQPARPAVRLPLGHPGTERADGCWQSHIRSMADIIKTLSVVKVKLHESCEGWMSAGSCETVSRSRPATLLSQRGTGLHEDCPSARHHR